MGESFEQFRNKVGVFLHSSIGTIESYMSNVTESLGAEKTTGLLRERCHFHKDQEDYWKNEKERRVTFFISLQLFFF